MTARSMHGDQPFYYRSVASAGVLNIGILVGEGMSISPGFYLFDTCRRRLGRLAAGHLMEAMATACLDQIS